MRVAVLALVGTAFVAAGVSAAALRETAASPTVAQLVGQRLVVAIRGTSPGAQVLERVRAGQVGGVILFGANVRTPAQVRSLTARLQSAARAGGQPPLLIAID